MPLIVEFGSQSPQFSQIIDLVIKNDLMDEFKCLLEFVKTGTVDNRLQEIATSILESYIKSRTVSKRILSDNFFKIVKELVEENQDPQYSD